MSTDITNESEENVELTEKDLDVIDDINRENEPEETTESSTDDTSGGSEEADEPQTAEAESDDTPDSTETLTRWANHYGINPDDYANEDALRRHVESTANYYQQAQQAQQLQQQQYAQQTPTDTREEPPAPKKFQVGLDDDYDEGLRDAINGLAAEMKGHYDDQMSVLAQAVMSQQQFIGGQQEQVKTEQYRSELDSFNEAVGDISNEGLFGKEGYQDLSPGSTEAHNREQLYDQVLVLASGYQQQGRQLPPMEDLVNQAYRVTFSTEVDNQSRKSFNDRVRSQAKRRLGSGSSTKKTSVPTDDPVDNPVLKDAFDGFLKDNGDL